MSETLLPFGIVIGNFLSTTHDEVRNGKIEVSDCSDWWKPW